MSNSMFFFILRDHYFDTELRGSRNPKKKCAKVPDVDEPARGTQPIRSLYRVDSSKIKMNWRFNLPEVE